MAQNLAEIAFFPAFLFLAKVLDEGYEFDITDTDIRLKFDETCALVES